MIKSAVILSTGDITDSNTTYVAEGLVDLGINVSAVVKVGGDKDKLLWALEQAGELGDLIVGTGGLEPMANDLTVATIAAFLGVDFKHGQLPLGAAMIANPTGNTPGFQIDIGQDKKIFWLPSAAPDLSAMLRLAVIPWIVQQMGGQSRLFEAIFKIYGLNESRLKVLLEPIDLGGAGKLSCRSHYPDLTLRLTLDARVADAAHFNALRMRIHALLGEFIYAEGDRAMEDVVGRLLMEKQQTLALAESCTGGLIGHRITSVAGSSAYFLGGAITYSNKEKIRALGVKAATLDRFGAVSRETALEMSRGIRERTGASIALSVTGIAGPSGGGPEKPVGTVWLSLARTDRQEARVLRLEAFGGREGIIQEASQAALNWLRLSLLEL